MLFSQNALLRDQNRLVTSQVDLLTDQNSKIDQQLALLEDQNRKIDQQTMVADSQKRGAFATELFAIVQAVAHTGVPKDGSLTPELVSRIVALTSSAVPYYYLEFQARKGGRPGERAKDNDVGGTQKRIPRPLSPERGQIISTLATMNVNLSLIAKAGARFDYADLRNTTLSNVDLTDANLTGCDFTDAKIVKASFSGATIEGVSFRGAWIEQVTFGNVKGYRADFSDALLDSVAVAQSDFRRTIFDGSRILRTGFDKTDISDSSFLHTDIPSVRMSRVSIFAPELPNGLPWPDEAVKEFAQKRQQNEAAVLNAEFQRQSP